MKNYPKAFEQYWDRAALIDWPGEEKWKRLAIKHIAYLAWMNGRKHQRNAN